MDLKKIFHVRELTQYLESKPNRTPYEEEMLIINRNALTAIDTFLAVYTDAAALYTQLFPNQEECTITPEGYLKNFTEPKEVIVDLEEGLAMAAAFMDPFKAFQSDITPELEEQQTCEFQDMIAGIDLDSQS